MKRTRCAFLAFLLLFCTVALLFSHVSVSAEQKLVAAEDRITRFLILGCDRSTRLTDSILLVSLNETEREARILQIPRDTYAEYTEGSYKKLNGAMNALDAAGTKAFLSEALGVSIDYFLVLNLDFFRELVDAIGGVEVTVPKDMEYSDPSQDLHISLKAGRVRLDGARAEQFVRYRSGYVDADLGRLDAQKVFLRAFAKQCRTLTPVQLLRVTGIVLMGVRTDIGLPAAIRVARVLMECDTEQIPMATLAGQAVRGRSGAWYYVLNRKGCIRMMREYLLFDGDFDPRGVFDRESNSDFHKIYTASEEKLPIFEF